MPPTETVKDNLVLNTRRASNGCVEWQGATNAGGYGILHWGLAHRLSYTLFIGPIPRGRCVLHTCDNRRCVRPSHLWIGSLADNIRDMDKKGRRRVGRGEKHASAKVTEALVREIRASYKPGRPGINSVGSIPSLSKKYRLGTSAVHAIVTCRSWRHVT